MFSFVTNRALNLAFFVPNVVSRSSSLIGAGLFTPVCALSGGEYFSVLARVTKQNYLTSYIFQGLLEIVNPSADIDEQSEGVIRKVVGNFFTSKIDKCEAKGFFQKHVVSRTLCVGRMLAAVIARVADCVIGLLVAPFAFLTLGLIPKINSLAFKELNISGVVYDLVEGIVKAVNPWCEAQAKAQAAKERAEAQKQDKELTAALEKVKNDPRKLLAAATSLGKTLSEVRDHRAFAYTAEDCIRHVIRMASAERPI